MGARAEQFCKRYVEGVCQFDKILQRRVSQGALDPGQVRPMHVRLFRQLFL